MQPEALHPILNLQTALVAILVLAVGQRLLLQWGQGRLSPAQREVVAREGKAMLLSQIPLFVLVLVYLLVMRAGWLDTLTAFRAYVFFTVLWTVQMIIWLAKRLRRLEMPSAFRYAVMGARLMAALTFIVLAMAFTAV